MKRDFSSSLSRRRIVQTGAAAGAAAIGHRFGAFAQTPAGSPGASPAASPAAEMDPAFLEQQDQVIADLKQYEGQKIRMLSAVVGGKNPEEDALWAKEFQRLTGVELELVHPTDSYTEKMQADLSGGVKYDLIYANKDTYDVMIEQEVPTDITDWINDSAILTNETVIPPAEWDQIRSDDKLYGVFNKREGARMITVRQDWMDKLGLEAPGTLDEVYDTMIALRDGDPAGNGSKPLGLSTAGTYDIQPFMSSAGIKSGYVDADGKRTIPYANEEATPAYEYLAKLFKEGLLDQNFATADTAAMRNLFMTDKVGMVTYWDTWVGLFNTQVLAANPSSPFVAAGVPAAEDANGDVLLTRGQPGVFFIPMNAENPELAFKILEWWNTVPAMTLLTLGIKDHDYTVDANGTYALTDVGKEHAMDHGAPTPYNTNWHNPVGDLPGLKEAQAISAKYGYIETITADWAPTIKPILDENIIKIILGQLSPSDGVSAMHSALSDAGMIDD